jgi:hypothetical protein
VVLLMPLGLAGVLYAVHRRLSGRRLAR